MNRVGDRRDPAVTEGDHRRRLRGDVRQRRHRVGDCRRRILLDEVENDVGQVPRTPADEEEREDGDAHLGEVTISAGRRYAAADGGGVRPEAPDGERVEDDLDDDRSDEEKSEVRDTVVGVVGRICFKPEMPGFGGTSADVGVVADDTVVGQTATRSRGNLSGLKYIGKALVQSEVVYYVSCSPTRTLGNHDELYRFISRTSARTDFQ